MPENKPMPPPETFHPPSLEDRLLAEYGADLNEPYLSDAEKKEVLLAIWQLMAAFVEYGFSVKAGDNFSAESDVGFDDVLSYLIPIDTAPETVAPQIIKSKEQP